MDTIEEMLQQARWDERKACDAVCQTVAKELENLGRDIQAQGAHKCSDLIRSRYESVPDNGG